jgi:type I restriction enzyme S subunit
MVDTVWAYFATKDKQQFEEYKGHWPDFAIQKTSLPDARLTYEFRNLVDPLMRKIRANELQVETLSAIRDSLLPRLISGKLRISNDKLVSQT